MDHYDTLLRRCALHPDSCDPDTLAQITLAQMRVGLYGGQSDLSMQPSFLRPDSVRATSPVAVALCSEREIQTARLCGEAREDGEAFPLPGADYPASLEDLSFALVELLSPLLDTHTPVCIIVPFSLRYEASGALFLQRCPAALRLEAWQGVDWHKSLRDALAARGFFPGSLRIVSSVIAAQFGALPKATPGARTMALYWDDGIDASFMLPDSAILKLRCGDLRLQALACDCGALCAVPAGVLDLSLDRDSLRPGRELLEKLLSLRYLGEVYRLAMIRAIEEGLLSFMCGRDFLSLRKLSADALLDFLARPDSDQSLSRFTAHEASDRKLALALGEAVLTRSLRLLLAQLLALLSMTGAGTSEKAPANIALGGAGFANKLLYAKWQSLLEQELRQTRGLHYTSVCTQDLLWQGAVQCLLRNP